jgi:hypothetical protein
MDKMAEAMIHDKYMQSSNSGNNIIHDENNTNHHDLDSHFGSGQIANNQEEINYGDKPGMYLTQHPVNQIICEQSPLKIHHHQQQQQLERRTFKMVNFEPLPVSVKKSRPSTEQTAQKIIIGAFSSYFYTLVWDTLYCTHTYIYDINKQRLTTE